MSLPLGLSLKLPFTIHYNLEVILCTETGGNWTLN